MAALLQYSSTAPTWELATPGPGCHLLKSKSRGRRSLKAVRNGDHLCRPYATVDCGHQSPIKVGLRSRGAWNSRGKCRACHPHTAPGREWDGELFPKHRSRAWILSSGLCHYARGSIASDITCITSSMFRCAVALRREAMIADPGHHWDHQVWMSQFRTIISLHLHSTLPSNCHVRCHI
jgi:hypothetical protein